MPKCGVLNAADVLEARRRLTQTCEENRAKLKQPGLAKNLQASRSPPNGQRKQGHVCLNRKKNKLFNVVCGHRFRDLWLVIQALLTPNWVVFLGLCFGSRRVLMGGRASSRGEERDCGSSVILGDRGPSERTAQC